jgi:uncharacterized protein DUF559
VARLAARQHGRVTDAQLRELGVVGHVVRHWRQTSYLHRTLPRVFAVGSVDRTYESDLFEAILYAGPGAMLSHLSAAHWLGLIDYPPPAIHVSTPRRVRSVPGVVVHGRRRLVRASHRGIPVTTTPQTMLDVAAARRRDPVLVRKGLARLDYRRQLDLAALQSIRKRGRPGSAHLGWAIVDHDPRFAHTLSPNEDDWIVFCEQTETPKPDAINERVEGILSDVVYRDARVIVELDGGDNHHSPAQIRRDRANDRLLRGRGWLVLRYTWDDVHGDPLGVHDDLLAVLRARTGARPSD